MLIYPNPSQKILLTGASGYVGGRLLKLLEQQNYSVRCLARNPAFLLSRVGKQTEVVPGDVLDKNSLLPALQGIHTAFYLVHSMGAATGFEAQESFGATNFAAAAKASGLKRIIYLGGLGESGEDLSPHLRSRHEVGRILHNSGILTIELRASIVIGSGSLSFEMIRSLTEKLPVMIVPRWVEVLAQPIAIDSLLAYLIESIHLQIKENKIFEIGGTDRLSYGDLMREYARQRGLKRYMIRVPVLTPRLSSLWLGLVTPLYARIGRKLIDSIRHPTVVTDDSASQYFSVKPLNAAGAIRAALLNEEKEFAATRWSDAISSSGLNSNSYGGVKVKNRLIDTRSITVNTNVETAFQSIARIGGKNGWYAYNFLWRSRGIMDLLIGGVGMRRGRPVNRELRAGDALDFWRVEVYEPPKRLRLRAEMKVPGKAWLEFEVQPTDHRTTIHQTAIFYPSGLWGLIYWYGIYPLHTLVFRGMLRKIGEKARREDSNT